MTVTTTPEAAAQKAFELWNAKRALGRPGHDCAPTKVIVREKRGPDRWNGLLIIEAPVQEGTVGVGI